MEIENDIKRGQVLPDLQVDSLSFLLSGIRGKQISEFPETTLRGGLGYSMKRMFCLGNHEKGKCGLHENCPYGVFFESHGTKPADEHRGGNQRPRPWRVLVLNSPQGILVRFFAWGEGRTHIGALVAALRDLGTKGLGRNGLEFEPVIQGNLESLSLTDIRHFLSEETMWGLDFVKPLTLRRQGTVLKQWDHNFFFETLLRRVENVCGDSSATMGESWDFLRLAQKWNEQVRSKSEMSVSSRSRISTRQKKNLDYSGLTGRVLLQGVDHELQAILKVGEILGVGKNTVFGAGGYHLVPFISEY